MCWGSKARADGLGDVRIAMALSRTLLSMLAALFLTTASFAATAEPAAPPAPGSATYTVDEVVAAGHMFFGSISGGLATMVESLVSRYGLPNGYVVGQEGGGAFVGGLRFGDGTLYTKWAAQRQVYWQGPSLGFDFGGDGNRTMMLVYDLPSELAMFRRYGGVEGSAYLVSGLGMTVLANTELPEKTVYVVPIRSGLGARLGLNVGYLKFTPKPTLNPF
jgi:hypothetical protein